MSSPSSPLVSGSNMGFGTGSDFSQIYSMFGPAGGSSSGGTNLFGANLSGAGGGAGTFGYSTPSSSNPNNVASYAQSTGLMGQAAGPMISQGGNLVNLGTDVSGQGFGTTGQAFNTLADAMQYYQNLMSGNPATVASAAAPYAATLQPQYQEALTRANQGARGGLSAVTASTLPQTVESQVGNFELGLQPQAAAGLNTLAGTENQIANTQGNIGTSLAGTGTTLTSQALQALNNIASQALQKVNLNQQTDFANTFGQITQGIGTLLGGAGNAATGLAKMGVTV